MGILLVELLFVITDEPPLVSIPSQVGILLVEEANYFREFIRKSQYPLRWASSWWRPIRFTGARATRLNTLSGGHPLGGRNCGGEIL